MKTQLYALGAACLLSLSACGGGAGNDTLGGNNKPTPDDPAKATPSINGVQLVEYTSNGDPVLVQTLKNSDKVVLSGDRNLVKIEALPTEGSETGSVFFSLEGPIAVERTENNLVSSYSKSKPNFGVSVASMPKGQYKLRVTPYSKADRKGSSGETSTIDFSVSTDEVEPTDPTVPAITELRVLDASNYSDVVRLLKDGDSLNLAQMPSAINIEAVSADADGTGSVDFVLQGPVDINRVENSAIYVLADSSQHFDLAADALPEGDYTLKVTPYLGADATGEAGTTVVANFTVTDEPTVAPVVANDDSYQVETNQQLDIDSLEGVKSNDTAEQLGAAKVSLATLPEHGALVLNSDGSFTFQPDTDFSGIDHFTYTLADENGSESLATVTVSVINSDSTMGGENKGFTPIVASSDTRTIYVSSSEGMDANSGLSVDAPVRTLDKAFDLARSGYPDHVLLKRGDVWVDEELSNAKSGRSESEPAVIAFYGESGDRPKLKTSGKTLYASSLYHVNIIGLEIEAYKLNPADPAFDGTTDANIRMVGDFEDILFEDMKLRFIEFIIQGWEGKPRDIHIRRSMVLDKYSANTSYNNDSRPSGIYTDNGEGLVVEDSLWDHNGWNAEVVGAGANMYNHNLYLSQKGNVGNKIVVRNNIITRASALGVHGRPGGLYENNFFGRNPIGLQMGYRGGAELPSGTFAYAFNNVVTEGLNMNRGIDSCSSSICTGAIWGIQVENLGSADVRVEGNIVSNRFLDETGYPSGIRYDSAAKYSNNIVYRWDSSTQGTNENYPDPGRTLADYNASLGGERSFEAFINTARNRGLQQWDERYTADAINDYIRAGFGR